MQRTLIVIPARMQSTRLPGKPMADIAGEPMIVHVWRRAMAAETGRVVVATDTEEIVAAVRKAGGEAVMTRADHASGSDRVFEAVNHVDPEGEFEIIVNLQGDLPTLEPASSALVSRPLQDRGRHRHDCRRDHRRGRAHQPERGQGRRHAQGCRGVSGPVLHAGDRAGTARGRSITTRHVRLSPDGARALRLAAGRRRWRSARSWSSCVRWRTACAST